MSLYNKEFNAFDYFIGRKKYSEDLCMIDTMGETVTYKEFYQRVKFKDQELFNKFNSNVRCLFILNDCIDLVELFYGALSKNAISGIIPYSLEPCKIIKILNRDKYNLIVTDVEKSKSILEILKTHNNIFKQVKIHNLVFIYINKICSALPQNSFIIYSSGSTGLPKGILHKQIDMKYATDTYGKNILKLSNKDLVYPLSSISYGFSFTTATFQVFEAGAAVLISSNHNTFKIIDTIQQYKPTILCGVPSIFSMLLKIHTHIANIDLTSVKFVLSSGENLNSTIMNSWNKIFNIPLIEGYGSVEMLTNVISNTRSVRISGSAGKIVKGFSYRIDNKGILIIKGNCISTYEMGKDNLSQITNIFYTKDVFSLDKNGYFWYNGRIDDKFKFNGIWLNPIDIEKEFLNISSAHDCYIVKHNKDLYLFYKSSNNLNKSELKDIYFKLREKFVHSICPTIFVRVEDFKYNHNGKKIRLFFKKNRWTDVEKVADMRK